MMMDRELRIEIRRRRKDGQPLSRNRYGIFAYRTFDGPHGKMVARTFVCAYQSLAEAQGWYPDAKDATDLKE